MKVRRSTQQSLAAALAASVLVLTACGSTDDPATDGAASDPAATQDPTTTDQAGGLSADNLLTDADAIYPNGGSDWRATDTLAGDGPTAFNPCARAALSDLGAASVLRRDFEFVVTDPGPETVEPTLTLNEVVGEFGSDAAARAAYVDIEEWLQDCLPSGADDYRAGDFTPIAIPGGEAEVQLSTYRPVPEDLDPYGDEGWFLETGLVVAGDRIAVLTQLTHGQDYNWPDGTPVRQMLPVAAERLAGDGGQPSPSASGSPSGSASASATVSPAGLVTTIPADFPLAAYPAEPPAADSETTITGPESGFDAVGDLAICGVAPLTAKPADRLGYRVEGIEWGDTRELRTYATAAAAVAEVQTLRDRLADCDREPSGQDGWSRVWQVFADADTGYDSVTYGYTTEMDDSDSFAPSGELTTVVRVGHSVLIVTWYAEYSAEAMGRNVPGLLDTVDLIAPAMCAFTEAGC